MMENQKNLSEQQKRDFCAHLQKQYGIFLSPQDELLPVYYSTYTFNEESRKAAHSMVITWEKLSKELRQLVAQMKLDIQGALDFFIKRLEAALSKIEVKQVRFNSNWEAFYFGLGSRGSVGIVAIICLFSAFYMYRQDQKNERLSSFIEKAVVEEKSFNSTQGVSLIKLYQAANLQQAIEGTHFVYNESCKCVEVPLRYIAR